MHVLADLSAYLDEELAPAERARVSTHLEACGRCAASLAELRATATLISALPSAQPSRSLVPALTPRWNWLRPMRSLSAVASGAFLMVFLVSAVAQSGSNLGGGPTSPFGGAATQAGPAAQPAAAPGAATAELAAATAAPMPASLPPERALAPAPGAPVATPTAATDAQRKQEDAAQSGAPGAFGAATGTANAAAAREDLVRTTQGYGPQQPPSPLIWLMLAIAAAAFAGVAHWRLRTA